MELLQDMQETRIRPNDITYSTLIDALGWCGRWEYALSLFNGSPSKGITPTNSMYNPMLKSLLCGKQRQKADEIYSRMIAAGIKHDKYTPKQY
jgi:pentatricopeptide repeat protein